MEHEIVGCQGWTKRDWTQELEGLALLAGGRKKGQWSFYSFESPTTPRQCKVKYLNQLPYPWFWFISWEEQSQMVEIELGRELGVWVLIPSLLLCINICWMNIQVASVMWGWSPPLTPSCFICTSHFSQRIFAKIFKRREWQRILSEYRLVPVVTE